MRTIRSDVREYEPPVQKINIDDEINWFMEAMMTVEPNYDEDKADLDIMRSVFAWVFRYDRLNVLELDYNKGMFLYGSMGRGKSMTLRGLYTFINKLRSRKKWYTSEDFRLKASWISATQLANNYALEGQEGLQEYYERNSCLFIDELGREPIPASNYGTKLNVLQFLLQLRYDYRRSGVTHVTTNLTLEEIPKYYGYYIADRCLEMFNFIEFKGESLRR